MGWRHRLGAPHVHRHRIGPDDDPADVAVAGDPAGAGGGDGRPHAGGCSIRPGVGRDEVLDADQYPDVRSHGPQDRQVAGGQRQVAQLDQGITAKLSGRPGVPGAPGGRCDRFDGGGHLLPADRVEDERAGERATQQPGHREGPTLGGVGLRAVGIQVPDVEADGLPQAGMRHLRRADSERLGHLRHVDLLLGGPRQPVRCRDRRDRGHRLDADRPGGEHLLHGRQRLQRPAALDQPPGRGVGQPRVGTQPGSRRLQSVVLDGRVHLRPADRAGEEGGDPVLRGDQGADPVELLIGRQSVQIVGGEAAAPLPMQPAGGGGAGWLRRRARGAAEGSRCGRRGARGDLSG